MVYFGSFPTKKNQKKNQKYKSISVNRCVKKKRKRKTLSYGTVRSLIYTPNTYMCT